MKEQGQITPDSKFGQAIIEIARRCVTAVETGTFNGLGSTQCILQGLPPEGRLWSVEISESRFKEASDNCREAIATGRLTLLHGTVFGPDLMREYPMAALEHTFFCETAEVEKAANVIAELPDKFDLLMMDGGVFSGIPEFLLLADHARFIVMDDTFDPKNRKPYTWALDRHYKLLVEDQKDRNGWAIFERVEL